MSEITLEQAQVRVRRKYPDAQIDQAPISGMYTVISGQGRDAVKLSKTCISIEYAWADALFRMSQKQGD